MLVRRSQSSSGIYPVVSGLDSLALDPMGLALGELAVGIQALAQQWLVGNLTWYVAMQVQLGDLVQSFAIFSACKHKLLVAPPNSGDQMVF